MLAEQIVTLRKKAGMSQQRLAERLQVVPSAIGMYEQGRRTPSIDILIQMAEVFQVSLDYLITGRESVYAKARENCDCVSYACPCQAHAVYDSALTSKCK